MALPEDFSKIYGSTATGGLTPISDVDYAKGWEFVGSNPPTKNDFSYLQNMSDLKSQWLYANKLQRSNPFGDIKSDGASAIAAALSNLGLGGIATSSDIQNGTAKKLIDAAGLKSFLPKRSFALNDFVRIPDVPGGLIIQWGTFTGSTGEGVKNVIFPTPFPNFSLIAMATPINSAANPGIDVFSQVGGLSNSDVNFVFAWITTTTPADGFRWLALGF